MDDQQRARELWSDALRKVGQHEFAYHVGCGGDLDLSERATLDAITAALRAEPEGFVLVSVEPTVGLLMSMAVRRDHGLGYPGYYDDPAFGGAGWHQRRLDAALGYARQQHEEVVGHGFYSADREQQYASLAARPQEASDAT